jgi:hypothetical protein
MEKTAAPTELKGNNKRKVLLFLAFSLVVFLSVYAYLYFRNVRSYILPERYAFLEGALEEGEELVKAEVKGIIYNREISGDLLSFDINIWDETSKKSLYYDHIDLDVSLLDSQPEKGEIWASIFPEAVNMGFVFSKTPVERKIFEFPKKVLVLESWGLEEMKLSKEEIEYYAESLYEVIKSSQEVEEIRGDKGEILTRPITRAHYDAEGVEESSTDGIDSLHLYPLLTDSLLWSFCRSTEERFGLCEETGIANLDLPALIEEELEKQDLVERELEKWIEELKKENPDRICSGGVPEEIEVLEEGSSRVTLTPIGQQGFACTIVSEILKKSAGSKDRNPLLLKKYCDLEEVEGWISFAQTREYAYEISDMSRAISIDRLNDVEMQMPAEVLMPLPNQIAFLGDVFNAKSIYGDQFEFASSDIDLLNRYTANAILSSESLSLGDFCMLAYSSKEANSFSGRPFYEKNLLSIWGMLEQDKKTNFQSMEEELFYSSLCFLAFPEDLYVQQLQKITVMKYLHLNFPRDQREGLWSEGLTEYNVRDNTMIFKILLSMYE